MTEIFKIIDFANGKYSVSNAGIVINNRTANYLSLRINKDGYCQVNLYYDKNKFKTFRVHRLVAMAFIPNTENKPSVNHENGIRNDNRVGNLKWATLSEQQTHSYSVLGRKGAMTGKPSYLNSNAKKIIAIFKDGTEKEYGSLKDFSKEFNVIYTNASRVLRGRAKSINGIKLKYFEPRSYR